MSDSFMMHLVSIIETTIHFYISVFFLSFFVSIFHQICLQSHPVSEGPTFAKCIFNSSGQSPLVKHFLQRQGLQKRAGTEILLQRTEIDQLPPYPLHYLFIRSFILKLVQSFFVCSFLQLFIYVLFYGGFFFCFFFCFWKLTFGFYSRLLYCNKLQRIFSLN